MIQRKGLKNPCKLLILVLVMTALFVSCGDSKQNDADLKQAFELHKEAIKIRNTVKDQMAKLKANTDSLFVETYTEELNILNNSLVTWDEQLVEVPGFEEEHDHSHHDHSGHDHDHDHDHDHHAQQELTPKQHLEVQHHLLQEIQELADKVDNIKQ